MLTCQQRFLALCYVRFPGAESAESLTTHDYMKSLLRELTNEAPGGRGQDNMDVLCAMWQVLKSYIGQGRLDGGTGACPALGKEKMPYVFAGGRAWACSRNQRTWGRGRDPSVSEGIYGKQAGFWPSPATGSDLSSTLWFAMLKAMVLEFKNLFTLKSLDTAIEILSFQEL